MSRIVFSILQSREEFGYRVHMGRERRVELRAATESEAAREQEFVFWIAWQALGLSAAFELNHMEGELDAMNGPCFIE